MLTLGHYFDKCEIAPNLGICPLARMQAGNGAVACNFTPLRPMSALAEGGAGGMGTGENGPQGPQPIPYRFAAWSEPHDRRPYRALEQLLCRLAG